MIILISFQQIVTSSYTDLQDYTYYFVPAPWLCVKLLKLLQLYPPPGNCITLFMYLYCSIFILWFCVAIQNIMKGVDQAPCVRKEDNAIH